MSLSWDPYDNERGLQLSAILASFATLFVLLRFWTRIRQPNANLWWDDWLLLIDLPILWAQTGLLFCIFTHQLRQPTRELSDKDVTLALKFLFAYYHLFNWGISLAKLSALFFYFRAFSVYNTMSICIKVVGVLTALWPIAFTLSAFGECKPLAKAWDPNLPGTCFDIRAWWLANAVTDVVLDLCVLMMPMPILWNMKLNLGQKIWICLVFVAGYGFLVGSLRRSIAFVQYGEEMIGVERLDVSHNVFPPKDSYWPIYEVPTGIVCVCLPIMFSLVKLVWKHGVGEVLFSLKSLPSQNAR